MLSLGDLRNKHAIIVDSPRESTRSNREWFWTTSAGSFVSWGILLAAFALVWVVKWGGLRSPETNLSEGTRWLLGWTPSLLAGLALPYVWPAFRRRALGQPTRIDFLPECAFAPVILSFGEISDWFLPKVGDTAPQTFAISDLLAVLAGSGAAWLLYQTIVEIRAWGGRRQTIAGTDASRQKIPAKARPIEPKNPR